MNRRLAIATLSYETDKRGLVPHHCDLYIWCSNAHRLAMHIRGGADVMVLSNMPHHVSRECGDVQQPQVNDRLVDLARAFTRTRPALAKSVGHGRFAMITLLKWQLMHPSIGYRLVMFLDLDIDVFYRKWTLLQFQTLNHKLDAFERNGRLKLAAAPDHSSPINSGVMLFKPSRRLYSEGIELLRTMEFNTTHGFNHSGPPAGAIPPHLHTNSRAFRLNTWDFVGANTDQGLFTHIFLVKHGEMYTKTTQSAAVPVVRHFWGGDKPLVMHTCKKYFRERNATRVTPCAMHIRVLERSISARARCKGVDWPLL